MNVDKTKADWLSLIMHFIVGAVVALLLGFAVIMRRRRGIWLDDHLILPFIVGACLLGGGLGSKFGDRLWLANSYKVIPPTPAQHSKISTVLSITSAIVGALLVVSSLARHFM